ncbi:MAG: hypothetical protein J1F65_04150 [Clostridiales bacterium]|nr:hypothetical protein [Clostridiales bacterium]
MVRFTVKFKEYLLIVPILTIAMTIATVVVATRIGMNDTVWIVLCIEIFVILFDCIVMLYSLNVAVSLSFFGVVVACFVPLLESPFADVQYVALVCHSGALVVANIILLLQLIVWQITVENDGFSYRALFHRKRFYKYSEVTKIEFFRFGYKVFVGNERIRCYLQTRNNDAFYEQIMKPNVPMNKIRF